MGCACYSLQRFIDLDHPPYLRLSIPHTLKSVTKAPQEASLRTLVSPSQTLPEFLPIESRTATLIDGGTCVNPPSEKMA